MIPSWCRVGQKVVCIKKGEWTDRCYGEVTPIFGDVLTIRTVDISDSSLTFVEIVNDPQEYLEGLSECRFGYERFKPLIRKTIEEDIAIFLPLLKTVKEEEFVE